MTGFFALLRLQLLSRFADLKPANLRAQMSGQKKKAVIQIAAYAFLIVWFAAFIIPLEDTVLTALQALGAPQLLPALAITASMLCTLIMSFFFIMSSLYFNRDSAFLAALPIRPRTVLCAKLTQIWISETLISMIFVLPASVLYGLRLGLGAGFYGRMLLIALTVAVLPIAVVTLLSTLLIRLSALWKKRELMSVVFGCAFLVIYMVACANIGSFMGEGAEQADAVQQFLADNQARIADITRAFPPAAWAAQGMLGDAGALLRFLLTSLAAAGITIYGVGLVYRQLSLLPTAVGAAGKKAKGGRAYQALTPFQACCKREMRQLLRVSPYAMNSLPTALMPAVMVVVFAMAFNRAVNAEGGAQRMDLVLSELTPAVAVALLAALMCFMAGINPAVATAVSREGKGHDVLTALPVSARTLVQAKLMVGLRLALVGLLPAAALLIVFAPGFALEIVLALALSGLYCFICAAISLARDVRSPKLNWVTETEAIKQNTGSMVSIFAAWGILLALGALSVLLLKIGAGLALYCLALGALLGAGAWLSLRYLMRCADRCYCQG